MYPVSLKCKCCDTVTLAKPCSPSASTGQAMEGTNGSTDTALTRFINARTFAYTDMALQHTTEIQVITMYIPFAGIKN